MKDYNKQMRDTIPSILPVVPTIDVVVFPNMIVPLLALDDRIVNGVNKALKEDKLVLLLASRQDSEDNSESIGTKDLYSVGTVASIMRIIKIPEGGIKILVQGIAKARVNNLTAEREILEADVSPFFIENNPKDIKTSAQIKNIKNIAEKISLSDYNFSPDFHIILSKMEDPEKIADFILSHLNLNIKEAQKLLETQNQNDFLQGLHQELIRELEMSKMQENIRDKARDSMNNSQREFYLREQLKAIKKELGEDDADDLEKLRSKLSEANLPEEVNAEVVKQLNRLEKTSPESMESAITRNYLEWILALPWNKSTEDNLNLNNAKIKLDLDHHGLNEIKERILDYISIKQLKGDSYTPILCFIGPPGTGKTSLGKSIAKSLGRKSFRVSLGGVKDEAEIRGHRRTYVGAMPGRFIQGIRKADSINPVIIIDELDKIGADFRGDPSAAMLEILDPQQNKTFHDNYLGVPFDLSKVLFIATANTLETLSAPLRDRMEVIELNGYTIEEKMNIARKHLISNALEETGLENHPIEFSDEVINDLICSYTREAGVRELERLIKKLCSKAARCLVEKNQKLKFDLNNIQKYLGSRKFKEEEEQCSSVGICNGLAWTQYGGEIIKVEAVMMPGKGKLLLTGQLGDVMKESAQAALSYAKAHAKEFNIEDEKFKNYDLHIHVPAGAIPKDGPSAGVTLLSAILSTLTQRPINTEYAMTGEINLRGHVMPIGGVKEKILAAKRNKIPRIILPFNNQHDLLGQEDILKGIDISWVKHADEILNKVLMENEKVNVH